MNQPTSRISTLHRHRRGALAAAVFALLTLALALAPEANAGTYRAVQCHERLGAGRADAEFRQSSPHYAGTADCHAAGLGITHDPGREPTKRGRSGSWTIATPGGTEIVRIAARVGAAAGGGHVPELFLALAGGARQAITPVHGRGHRVTWSGVRGRALTARLGCSRRGGCGPGLDAHVHLRNIALALRDSLAPSVEPAGSLLAGGARRGVQSLQVAAADPGSGVRAVSVEVNGDPLDARVLDCHLAGAVALRLRPCPAAATPGFDLATTSPRFRQGPNRLRVCAADYAQRATANLACATRTVRVDNLCPLSATPGTSLTARFRGAGSHVATRSDRPVTVTGRLTGAGGGPVVGARVCVGARARGGEAAERILATPATNARGAFTARIPAGPSREIRVAHWPDSERALERHLTLRARAIPRLRVRPNRTLENGQRVRFTVRLPGPASAHRRVAIEARADGRWIRIAGGRTSHSGSWRARYRFHATTGTRRYAFRAVVPRQAGYPYEGGRSRIAHARVAG
jgi:hypothetical protein